MKTIKQSKFFEKLLSYYCYSPSVLLCRIPELELFSTIELEHPVLDHCCGDGLIAGLAFPGVIFESGIDINREQLEKAKQSGIYQAVEYADASVNLPFPNRSFATIINNSGIEHILDLDATLSEIARVIKPGGKLYINVLNSRYFERWPLPASTLKEYAAFQPFYHALSEDQWRGYLEKYRFKNITFANYFPEHTSRIFAELDYKYSAHYFRKKISPEIILERITPKSILINRWRSRLENLPWQAEEKTGSGFMICATKQED